MTHLNTENKKISRAFLYSYHNTSLRTAKYSEKKLNFMYV